MEILLILLGIIVVIVIVVLIKYFTDPKVRKAANILAEYEEKEKFQSSTDRINSSDDDLLEWVKDNPDDGSDDWLNKASEIILDENKYNEDYVNSDLLEDILSDLEEYTENDDSIELPIRGINFRNLTEANIGSFDGYIMPDKENKHDKYAIGVYDSNDTHFGFIEKGQKVLYDKIEDGYGYIDGKLEINTFFDEETGEERFYGTITIDKEYLS